jgi:hypothetical protein
MTANKNNFTFSQYLDFILSKRIESNETVEALRKHEAETLVMERNLKEYRTLKRMIERYRITLN